MRHRRAFSPRSRIGQLSIRSYRRGDIRQAMMAQAGGKVLGEPMDIPGVGLYVSCFDTEGNRVSMLEPSQRMTVRSSWFQKSKRLGIVSPILAFCEFRVRSAP